MPKSNEHHIEISRELVCWQLGLKQVRTSSTEISPGSDPFRMSLGSDYIYNPIEGDGDFRRINPNFREGSGFLGSNKSMNSWGIFSLGIIVYSQKTHHDGEYL